MMTKVGRIIENEKHRAIKLALARAEKEKKMASKESVVKMLRRNYPSEEIAYIISDFSLDDIEAIRKEIMDTE